MRLVVLEGPTARPTFEIHQQRTLIGRAPECDVLVYDAQVSRHHAQILRLGDAYIIESLQPANPAIVNDRVTVERRRLADGDLIVLGTVVLQVDLPPATVQPDDQWARNHRMPGAPAPISDHLDPEDYQETPGLVMPQDIEPSIAGHATLPPQSLPMAPAQPPRVEQQRRVEQPHTRPSAPLAAPQVSVAAELPPATTRTASDGSDVAQKASEAARTAPSPLQEALVAPAPPPPASQDAPADGRSPRAPSLPQLSPREQLRAVAARLGLAGQRLQTRLIAAGGGPGAASTERDAVAVLAAEHDRLGGDTELARLAELLSERLGNQTDIRALYRLGAEAAELGAWTRLAQHSIEEALRLAETLGVHRAL